MGLPNHCQNFEEKKTHHATVDPC